MLKRKANLTAGDKAFIVELVERHAHIIENKATDKVSSAQKAAAWNAIAAEYNAVNNVQRTDDQLKQV